MNALRSYFRKPLALGLLGLFILSSFSFAEERGSVSRQDQIKFEQKKARDNMAELENRMYDLANSIRELNPEDSARLLIGFNRAKEHLIVDSMDEVSKYLSTLELDAAAREQKEILENLESLKKLLLTTDLDLEIKLDQLRKIKDAMGQLNSLIGKEQQQRDGTGDLEKGEAPFDDGELGALKTGEEQNQKAGADLAELSSQIGPIAAKATDSLKSAGKSMGQAAGQLGSGKPGSAGKKQEQALRDLDDAKNQLGQAQQQLQEEVEAEVRQMVMEQLKDMLAQQSKVRGATEKLVPRVETGNPQAVLATKRLSPAEEKIGALGAKSRELVELTEFSMVLPIALGALNSQISFVRDDLGVGKANQVVVSDEKKIESSLESLLEAMEDASKSSEDAEGQGECKGCKGDRNKLLAEVKMLRWMQFNLNGETKKANNLIKSGDITEVALLRRSKELQSQQKDIRSIAEQLHSKTCTDCVNGIH